VCPGLNKVDVDAVGFVIGAAAGIVIGKSTINACPSWLTLVAPILFLIACPIAMVALPNVSMFSGLLPGAALTTGIVGCGRVIGHWKSVVKATIAFLPWMTVPVAIALEWKDIQGLLLSR
jgi:hypothetical protein